MNFIEKNHDGWDSNTCIIVIGNAIESFYKVDAVRLKKYIERCIVLLEECLNKNIVISDDYKRDGKLPGYLEPTELKLRIDQNVQYWKNIMCEEANLCGK